MNHAKNRSRARLGGLLALGVAALLAIPVVSAARSGGDDDSPNHEKGHHHRHGHHHSVVGTIASFDAESGELAIDLRNGGSVSGLVDDRTKIKCEDQSKVGHRRGHDDNGTGANCTTADLVEGADVEEADLEVEHGTRHFDEVELAH